MTGREISRERSDWPLIYQERLDRLLISQERPDWPMVWAPGGKVSSNDSFRAELAITTSSINANDFDPSTDTPYIRYWLVFLVI